MADGEDAMAAEMARYAALRANSRQQSMDAIRQDAAHVRRVPPHRAAAEVAEAVFESGGMSRVPTPDGEPDAYRLDGGTLIKRPAPQPRSPSAVNPAPPRQTNPRFKKAGG